MTKMKTDECGEEGHGREMIYIGIYKRQNPVEEENLVCQPLKG